MAVATVVFQNTGGDRDIEAEIDVVVGGVNANPKIVTKGRHQLMYALTVAQTHIFSWELYKTSNRLVIEEARSYSHTRIDDEKRDPGLLTLARSIRPEVFESIQQEFVDAFNESIGEVDAHLENQYGQKWELYKSRKQKQMQSLYLSAISGILPARTIG